MRVHRRLRLSPHIPGETQAGVKGRLEWRAFSPATAALYLEFTAFWHGRPMFHVLGCITQQHDLRLVLLAAVLCLFACTTAMTMIARGRAAANDRMQTFWLVIGGIVAGCGIWGLHFVAMLAYRSGLPVAYDLPRTILSVVIAASLCAVGFRTALGPFGGAV